MSQAQAQSSVLSSKPLAGKVAVVTGASSGIGQATAIALARAGAHVAMLARREDRMADVASSLKDDGFLEPLVIQADCADLNDVRQAMTQVTDKLKRIDILVNNAGVMYIGPVIGARPEDWKKMFDINVLGLMYCTHAALPLMQEQKCGHIVNISSVSGRHVTARSAAYSATKFAVGAFSDGLRQEVHKLGIRVTVVEPGAVLTELTDHIPDPATKQVVKDWVGGMRSLDSQDIASAIVYATSQPQHVNVNEILIRPTDQA